MGTRADDDDPGERAGIRRGALYVVATPIGNLADLSPRARDVLSSVDAICAEDTRTTGVLLRHFGIQRTLTSLHEHNESAVVEGLLARLRAGAALALVSDAGTPLVSDPGYALVRAARIAGLQVFAIPGPSAALAALSIAGLPSDRFVFEGFLPAKHGARVERLRTLSAETRTLILFESAHRIEDCARDLAETFGGERTLVVARELTKRFEDSAMMPAGDLAGWLAADENRRRGEFVLVVDGAPEGRADDAEVERVLRVLLPEVPPAAAARIASALTGHPRRAIYDRAVKIASTDSGS